MHGRQSERLCPSCKAGTLQRVKRKGLLLRVPRSKSYQCPKCRGNFVNVLDLFTFRVRQFPGKKEIAVIAVGVISAIYLSYRVVVAMYVD